jgi:hypothetical protein
MAPGADKRVERARRDRDGLLQRFLRFSDPAELAKRGGEATVSVREIGVGPDPPFCRIDCSLVVAGPVKTPRQLVQIDPDAGARGSSLMHVLRAATPSSGRPERIRAAPSM